MAKTISATGKCLCGAVTVTANIATALGACHCEMCKHWGGPLLTTEVRTAPVGA